MHHAIVARCAVMPHPDPEVHSLAVGRVCGETIVVSKNTAHLQLGLYFPCELQLSQEFAAANDLIRRKDENGNPAGGMFDENRRVRAQKIRGVKSNGFWCPLPYLSHFGDISSLKEGDTITEFGGVQICKKYETPATFANKRANKHKSPKAAKKKFMFPEHKDTEQLKHHLLSISPDDELIVTLKLHGTSQRSALNLVESPKWYDKFLNWFGIFPNRSKLEYLNGTRRVTLSGADNGYYSEHFRTRAASKITPFLEPYMQVYYEVVGWENDHSKIMPSHTTERSNDSALKKKYGNKITYSYGCSPGEFEIYVYRISYVLPRVHKRKNLFGQEIVSSGFCQDGTEIDLPWDAVKEKCESWGVKHVPELARVKISNFDDSVDWLGPRDGNPTMDRFIEWIDKLSDGPDPIDPSHIREGVCVRVNKHGWLVRKNKGWTFKVLEGISKDRDDYVDQEEVS